MSKGMSRAEQEKQWQAEDDARVLKAYSELVKKKARLAMAKKKLLEEQESLENAIKLAK
jgi:hypothetical protein